MSQTGNGAYMVIMHYDDGGVEILPDNNFKSLNA